MESAMVVEDPGTSVLPEETETTEAQRIHLLAPPIDGGLLEQLRQSDSRISENWTSMNKISMGIGWDGYFIKKNEGWRALGYENEKHYRRMKGIARSTWYKMVGIAERLSHLTMDEFLAMTIENAEQLSVQPGTVKRDPELLRKAQTRTAQEFADDLVMHQAERENKPVGEVYVTMKWRIKQAQREVIERGLEDWQHEHGIDDEGYALELMIAEYRERPTLVGFMTESIPRLSRQVMAVHTGEVLELDELRALRETFAVHLQEMGEILRVCCVEATEDASSEGANK